MPRWYAARSGLVRLVGRLPLGMGVLSDTAAIGDRGTSVLQRSCSATDEGRWCLPAGMCVTSAAITLQDAHSAVTERCSVAQDTHADRQPAHQPYQSTSGQRRTRSSPRPAILPERSPSPPPQRRTRRAARVQRRAQATPAQQAMASRLGQGFCPSTATIVQRAGETSCCSCPWTRPPSAHLSRFAAHSA